MPPPKVPSPVVIPSSKSSRRLPRDTNGRAVPVSSYLSIMDKESATTHLSLYHGGCSCHEARRKSDAILGDTRSMRESKGYAKWKSMMDRGLVRFISAHPQTFLRRLKRGVPQDFRWEVWKVQLRSKKAKSEQSSSQTLPTIAGEKEGEERTGGSFAVPPRRRKRSLLISEESVEPSSSSRFEDGLKEVDQEETDLLSQSFDKQAQSSSSGVRKRSLPLDSVDLCPVSVVEYQTLAEKPSEFMSLISIDIPRTFPEIFHFDFSAQQQLARILNAFANLYPKVGYCQGMNFVIGFLLIVSNFCEYEVFGATLILFKAYQVEGLFRETFPLLFKYVHVYESVAQNMMPALIAHFEEEGVFPPVYLHQWFLTLYVRALPMRTVAVLWDYILAEGLPSLISLTVAVINVLQRFLLRLKFEDVVKFLKSLRLSGTCDETDIGRMLVQQASTTSIPQALLEPILNVDIELLCGGGKKALAEGGGELEDDSEAAVAATRTLLEEVEEETPIVPNPLEQCYVEVTNLQKSPSFEKNRGLGNSSRDETPVTRDSADSSLSQRGREAASNAAEQRPTAPQPKLMIPTPVHNDNSSSNKNNDSNNNNSAKQTDHSMPLTPRSMIAQLWERTAQPFFSQASAAPAKEVPRIKSQRQHLRGTSSALITTTAVGKKTVNRSNSGGEDSKTATSSSASLL